ncbi:MAG: TonB-dependent receptor [Halioglobus sp.]|nr:TonB-dependent receptor [Halioglobus sp.]
MGSTTGNLVHGRRFDLRLVASAVTLSLLCSGEAAIAAPLEEILVTAEKRAANIQDVPIAINAFDAADIDRYNILDTKDVARYTPGLVIVNSTGGKGQMQAYSRGVGNFDLNPGGMQRIGMYLDGAYLGTGIGGIYDLVDIERIEVLKGPQGTLYGRNTIGGAINIIAVKPDEEFAGHVMGLYGSDNQQALQGSVNIPLTDTLFSRFSGTYAHMDGLYENTNPGADDPSDQDKAESVRAALRWLASDNLTIDYSFDGTNTRDSTAAFWITGYEDPAAGSCAKLYFPACVNDTYPNLWADNILVGHPDKIAMNDTWYKFDSYRHVLNAEYDVNDNLMIKSVSAAYGYDRKQDTDVDGTAERLFNATKHGHYSSIQQDVNFIGTAYDDRLDYTLGANFFKEWNESTDVNNIFVDVPLPFGLDISSSRRSNNTNISWGIYGQGTYHFSDNTQLTLGTRYSEDHKESSTGEDKLDGTVDVPWKKSDHSWDNVSSVIRLAHNWTDQVMTYASWSQGYNAGGYPTRVSAVYDQIPFDEETVDTTEIGIKSTWFDRRLLINAAAYNNDYKDQQVGSFTEGVVRLINAGQSTIRGFELDVKAAPVEDVFIVLTYSYIDAQYDEFGEEDPDLFEAVLSPKNTFTALVEYTLVDNERLGRWTLSGATEYRDSQNFLLTVVQNDHIRSEAYTVYDAYLKWERAFQVEGLEFTARGTNLTNEVYKTSGIDFDALGWWGNNFGDPRRFQLEMNYRF